MNYQAIRATIEAPLLTAFNSQCPPIPVYFDNVTFVPPDPPNEYVRVNVTFGLTTEVSLTESLDNARGALIIRCFARKGAGPARCQEMIQIAVDVLQEIASSVKGSTGVFTRIDQITGPDFPAMNAQETHFLGKISTGWKATVLS